MSAPPTPNIILELSFAELSLVLLLLRLTELFDVEEYNVLPYVDRVDESDDRFDTNSVASFLIAVNVFIDIVGICRVDDAIKVEADSVVLCVVVVQIQEILVDVTDIAKYFVGLCFENITSFFKDVMLLKSVDRGIEIIAVFAWLSVDKTESMTIEATDAKVKMHMYVLNTILNK